MDEGSDFVGGTGDDLFLGIRDVSDDNGSTVNESTLSVLDDLQGGGGQDTLRINALDLTPGGGPTGDAEVIPSSVTLSSIETINVRAAVDTGTTDITTNQFADVETFNVTQGQAVDVDADAQDLTVSNATGQIDLDGGNNVTVNHDTADQNIKIGQDAGGSADPVFATGTIDVTDTDQGTGDILIDGGTDVTVEATAENTNASGDVTSGTITVGGGTTVPSGNVSITQNLNSDGTSSNNNNVTDGLTGGAVTATAGEGETVDITVNATSDAKDVDSDSNIAIGTQTVTAGESTTEITITQNADITPESRAASGGVTEQATVQFGELRSGDSISLDTDGNSPTTAEGDELAFTASKNLTAEEVAQAFSNLTAGDTQSDGGSVENGFFSGSLVDTIWTSGDASGDTVTFTSTNANTNEANDLNPILTNSSGNSTAPTVNTTQGSTPTTTADDSTNDVSFGNVVVDDSSSSKSVTDLTIDGYDGNAVLGGGDSLDELQNLTLRNSGDKAGTATLTTGAAALNLTVDDIQDDVDLDPAASTITDLTLTAENNASSFGLAAQSTEILDITANAVLDVTDGTSGFGTGLTDVTISGDSAVTLGDVSGNSNLNSFDASGNSGGITATVNSDSGNTGNLSEFFFSSGGDDVTLADTTVDTDVTLNAGGDTVTLASSTTTLGATVDAGAGTDRVVADGGDLSGNESGISGGLSNFEELEVQDQVDTSGAPVMINVGTLGFDRVITNGTSAGATGNNLILDELADNGTVVLTGAQAGGTPGSIQANVTNAMNETDNVVNAEVTTATSNLDAGTFIANEVETINITSTDSQLDNDGDGDAEPVEENTLEVDADSAETIDVGGNADLDLTLTAATSSVTLLDASDLGGDLTAATNVAGLEIQGGSGGDNLTAANNNVTLRGGDGGDTLSVNAGATSVDLFGGAGNDVFDFSAGSSIAVQDSAGIQDLGSGDSINLGSVDTFQSAQLTGVAGGSTGDFADAAINQVGLNGAAWFQIDGSTFIAADLTGDGSGGFNDAEDLLIEIVGEQIDLAGQASFNDNGTLEIA